MNKHLLRIVEEEEVRGKEKWGESDRTPGILLNAATEELGEVAHAINHEEGKEKVAQEISETIGILSRLYNMVMETYQFMYLAKEGEMFFRGTKSGVDIWFVLWGKPDTGYNADLYKTAYGLRNWLTNPAFRDLPIVRIAHVVLFESGWVEKECWRTKEGFLGAKAVEK